MSHDPRLRKNSQAGAPIVITDGTHAWQWIALSVSLAIELGILAILAWRFSLPPIPPRLAKWFSNWRPRSRRSLPWPTCAAAMRTSMPNSRYSMRSSPKSPGASPTGQLPGPKDRTTCRIASQSAGPSWLETEFDRRVAAMETELQKRQTQSEKLAYEINAWRSRLPICSKSATRSFGIVELQGRNAAEEDAGQGYQPPRTGPFGDGPESCLGAWQRSSSSVVWRRRCSGHTRSGRRLIPRSDESGSGANSE